MQYFVTAWWAFSAAHQIPDSELHSEPHGHAYIVRVTCESRFDQAKKRVAVDADELRHALEVLLEELNLRDLNVMLTGAEPTLEGIAAWILDRMALQWPVVRCEVKSELSTCVEVTRELRK